MQATQSLLQTWSQRLIASLMCSLVMPNSENAGKISGQLAISESTRFWAHKSDISLHASPIYIEWGVGEGWPSSYNLLPHERQVCLNGLHRTSQTTSGQCQALYPCITHAIGVTLGVLSQRFAELASAFLSAAFLCDRLSTSNRTWAMLRSETRRAWTFARKPRETLYKDGCQQVQ